MKNGLTPRKADRRGTPLLNSKRQIAVRFDGPVFDAIVTFSIQENWSISNTVNFLVCEALNCINK